MTLRAFAVALAGAALLVGVPASADEPYYFHKADVTKDAYLSDVSDCSELAGGVRVARYNVYTQNPSAASNIYAVGAVALFSGLFESRQRRQISARVERTCMADKGYSRRSIDKETHRELRDLEGDLRIERLFALVSAAIPSGKALVE